MTIDIYLNQSHLITLSFMITRELLSKFYTHIVKSQDNGITLVNTKIFFLTGFNFLSCFWVTESETVFRFYLSVRFPKL